MPYPRGALPAGSRRNAPLGGAYMQGPSWTMPLAPRPPGSPWTAVTRGLQPAWDPAEMGLGATLPHSKMAVVRGQPPENEA